MALVVGVVWVFSLSVASHNDSQQARVASSKLSKYPTSDEALKTLMSTSTDNRTESRDRDFATACATGAIKCGKVIIVKNAIPDSETDFTFYTNIPLYPSFVLDDDGTPSNPLSATQGMYTSANGSYLVAEFPSPDVSETFISCADPTQQLSPSNRGCPGSNHQC